jgi:hypothetical protein
VQKDSPRNLDIRAARRFASHGVALDAANRTDNE